MAASSAPGAGPMHFQVHPSVLFKLGEDLIRDNGQALAELIKNSYDADARTVRVEIDTENWFERRTGALTSSSDGSPRDPSQVRGRIVVNDDGVGMDRDAIRDGWLTVSYSHKREMKRLGLRTKAERTPLGDKGLGRLGVQRLGDVLILETRNGEQHADAVIDWSDYEDANTLESVPVKVRFSADTDAPGTTVSIVGLKEPDFWTGRGQLALQTELTSILSPYEAANDLRVYVTVNDEPLDLRSQARAVLDAAPVQYGFTYADGILAIESRTSARVLTGRTTEDRRSYRALIAPDNGNMFSEWLFDKHSRKAAEIGAEAGDDRFFIHSRYSVRLADLIPDGILAADPGPFSGEISSLDWEERPNDTAFDLPSELRNFAKSLAGLRVYRDGFGIRLGADWLGLSKQQTSGSSFYGLRPANAAGYVNLTARENAALEETSSRESFIDTPTWQGFYWLMRGVADYARRLQEFIRRNWNTYRAAAPQSPAVQELTTPAELAAHVESQLASGKALEARTKEARKSVKTLDTAVARITIARETSDDSLWNDPALSSALAGVITDLEEVRTRLRQVLDEIDEISRTQNELRGAVGLLREKLSATEFQISRAWESVALGLSAEVFSHEVDNIAERIRGRSLQVGRYLKNLETPDPRVLGFVEHVRSSSVELSRQSARLTPALRFRRERKSTHLVSELVTSVLEYHRVRWERESITTEVLVLSDFRIEVNEGKFSQIIDNLVLNSEYWIKRAMVERRLDAGTVRCEIDMPFLRVQDNGPGILPNVADSLFDPFVTTKPGDEGRGLGLFVVRQLLDSERATIRLTDELNDEGRPNTFELDLRSLMIGGSEPRSEA